MTFDRLTVVGVDRPAEANADGPHTATRDQRLGRITDLRHDPGRTGRGLDVKTFQSHQCRSITGSDA